MYEKMERGMYVRIDGETGKIKNFCFFTFRSV